jgi:uncharacterized membrane protein
VPPAESSWITSPPRGRHFATNSPTFYLFFAGIALVTALAAWAIPASHLTPGISEDMSWLPFYASKVDVHGVLLCGMVLGGVGVLNDLTITQASSVWELRAAAPQD